MLLIKYVWRLPIGLDMYNKIMKTFISFEPKKLLQNFVTLFSIGQTIYQIFQNAFHLHTIDTSILRLGTAIQEYRSTVTTIKEILKENSIDFSFTSSCKDLSDDIRRSFVEISEEPYRLWFLAKDMAYLEVLWKISQEKDFTKVLLVSSDTPYFKAEELYDIHLSKDSRVPSSITIENGAKHFLLSGPNGGGKSSFLRAILQTLLFSHTFGYSIGSNISLSPFDYILSGLSIHDSPGKKSLFEKEVCFARDVLYYNNPKFKGFVLFDEIFHSTNPPDGIRTSNLFLKSLWGYNHVASIVSTHVFQIIESSPDSVKKICVDAEKIGNTLKYKYSIRDGISRLSSVAEIWKKVWDA
jgi:DNA mismatch repair ATPase MutS